MIEPTTLPGTGDPVLYQYPAVNYFRVNYSDFGPGIASITTDGARFDYRGVRVSQRVTSARARRLLRLGFSRYVCRAAGRVADIGYVRYGLRYTAGSTASG